MIRMAKHIETGSLAIRKDVLVKDLKEFVIQHEMSAVAPKIYCIEVDGPDHYHNWQRTLPREMQKKEWIGAPSQYTAVSVYMEYCCKGTLLAHVGSSNVRLLKKYILQAYDVVNVVHSLKYLHLDIKPENFALNCANRVRIIDFGLALACKKGIFVCGYRGSRPYMSPEVPQRGIGHCRL